MSLTICFTPNDICAFAAAYLCHQHFFGKYAIRSVCTNTQPTHEKDGFWILLGLPGTAAVDFNVLELATVSIVEIYSWIHTNQPIPDWIWLIQRLAARTDMVYFDRLMETVLRPILNQAQTDPVTAFSSMKGFLRRYYTPVLMMDMIRDAMYR